MWWVGGFHKILIFCKCKISEPYDSARTNYYISNPLHTLCTDQHGWKPRTRYMFTILYRQYMLTALYGWQSRTSDWLVPCTQTHISHPMKALYTDQYGWKSRTSDWLLPCTQTHISHPMEALYTYQYEGKSRTSGWLLPSTQTHISHPMKALYTDQYGWKSRTSDWLLPCTQTHIAH